MSLDFINPLLIQLTESQEKTITYTNNGNYTVEPDLGKLLSKVNIEVDVASSGGGLDSLGYMIYLHNPYGYSDIAFYNEQEQKISLQPIYNSDYEFYATGAGNFTIQGYYDFFVSGWVVFADGTQEDFNDIQFGSIFPFDGKSIKFLALKILYI